jgi:DNA/RNA endonuclease YhcR with UshA esterase domain
MHLVHPASILRALVLLMACVAVRLDAEEKTAPAVVIPITDTAALKAHVGKSVSVSGKVSRVGMSKSGMIVFINFEGVPSGGFSAVVRSANLPDIEQAAGANLDAALPGRKIRVSGPISLYKEAPQIELKSADQIKVGR